MKNCIIIRRGYQVAQRLKCGKEIFVKATGAKYCYECADEVGYWHFQIFDQNGKKIGSNSIPTEGKVLLASNIFLKSGETKSYVVLIWLKETKENQNNEQDCHFTGSFDIMAEQIKRS